MAALRGWARPAPCKLSHWFVGSDSICGHVVRDNLRVRVDGPPPADACASCVTKRERRLARDASFPPGGIKGSRDSDLVPSLPRSLDPSGAAIS